MAVYQGTRLRTNALPAAGSSAQRARAAAPAAVSASPRVRPMGLIMAAIVVATMLGLVYLTQTLGTDATVNEIGTLEAKLDKIDVQINRIETEALILSQAEAVVPLAQDQELRRLGPPIVLSAP